MQLAAEFLCARTDDSDGAAEALSAMMVRLETVIGPDLPHGGGAYAARRGEVGKSLHHFSIRPHSEDTIVHWLQRRAV